MDHKTELGELFWSGAKRPPQTLTYDPEDPMSLSFIVAASNVLAYSFGLDYCYNIDKIKEISKNFIMPIINKKSDDIEEVIQKIVGKLKNSNFSGGKILKETIFQEDNETNFHIDLISALANLRARNYKFGVIDKLKIKLIAGKIDPRVITTTAAIVGTVGVELIKLLQVIREQFMFLF